MRERTSPREVTFTSLIRAPSGSRGESLEDAMYNEGKKERLKGGRKRTKTDNIYFIFKKKKRKRSLINVVGLPLPRWSDLLNVTSCDMVDTVLDMVIWVQLERAVSGVATRLKGSSPFPLGVSHTFACSLGLMRRSSSLIHSRAVIDVCQTSSCIN